MKKYLKKNLSLFLLCLAGSAVAIPNDPSGGACDGLDPSSGAYHICIQAYSAASRLDHLIAVSASSNAIDQALASLEDAIEEYEALGEGPVPGLVPFEIGDLGPGGGIIFSLSATGIHGLEAAPEDQPSAQWGCYTTDVPGADSVSDGAQNTADILAEECTSGSDAADVAAGYVWPNGQTDGFLPSKEELNLMWENLADSDGDGINSGPGDPNNVGGFAAVNYWSSTEDDSVVAWGQFFNFGGQGLNDKSDPLRVRAVRAF